MASTPMTVPAVVPLLSQVGGHPGVLTSEDESIIIKPCSASERQFYESLSSERALASLKPFTPKFLGTLRLEGVADENAQGIALRKSEGPTDKTDKLAIAISATSRSYLIVRELQSLVLENLSHPFHKPNILDIKLGTKLFDEFATAEKRARMEKQARETTSFETGVRLTGFQVHDNVTGQPVRTAKAYGKSIKPAELPEGIARFFPAAPPPNSGSPPAESNGLPHHILLPILKGLREDVREIRDVLASIELRMVAGSLLVIYESDWERAEEGLKKLDEVKATEEEDEDSDDEDGEKKLGLPYLVKVIDFAHTRLCPGKGPDESVLRGINTTLELLDGRINRLNETITGSY